MKTTPAAAYEALLVIMANTGWCDQHACIDAAVEGLKAAGHEDHRPEVEQAWAKYRNHGE